MNPIDLCERGLVPDAILRAAVRQLSRRRLKEHDAHDPAAVEQLKKEMMAQWHSGPIAIETDAANEQHYELPPAFFEHCLGTHLKYSCGYWPKGVDDLDESEKQMLELSCERAELEDGQQVLELGCGWGSLTLWMARHYPNSQILAVSNSSLQRGYIEKRAAAEGLKNVRVQTCDINTFDPGEAFDRVVSIEMMEHLRNHKLLFERIAGWLKPGGKLFSHVFCHREMLYPYEDRGDDDWMSRYFFTGGIMPSFDYFLLMPQHLQIDQRWWVPGTHYEATSNAWLARTDANRVKILKELEQHYSAADARIWLQRWRMFYIAVAEFFGLEGGTQWGVGHYRLTKR